jgi:hypothetical protein
VLLNRNNGTVWSSNTSRTLENPVAQLLDTGNHVVKDRNDDDPEKLMWQSFDFPCDTFLPGNEAWVELSNRSRKVYFILEEHGRSCSRCVFITNRSSWVSTDGCYEGISNKG